MSFGARAVDGSLCRLEVSAVRAKLIAASSNTSSAGLKVPVVPFI